jgi:hypothetical protein
VFDVELVDLLILCVHALSGCSADMEDLVAGLEKNALWAHLFDDADDMQWTLNTSIVVWDNGQSLVARLSIDLVELTWALSYVPFRTFVSNGVHRTCFYHSSQVNPPLMSYRREA